MGNTSRVACCGQGRTASRRSCQTHAIVTLDTLGLAVELSTDKGKELGNSQNGVKLQTQRKTPRVVSKINKNDKIIFRTLDANNRRCPKITMN
jgi:hypothetical protein